MKIWVKMFPSESFCLRGSILFQSSGTFGGGTWVLNMLIGWHFECLTPRSISFQPPFLPISCGACRVLSHWTNLLNLHGTLDRGGNVKSNRSGGKKSS